MSVGQVSFFVILQIEIRRIVQAGSIIMVDKNDQEIDSFDIPMTEDAEAKQKAIKDSQVKDKEKDKDKKKDKKSSKEQEFEDQANELPERLNPFASTFDYQVSIEEGQKAPSFRRQERELFEMAMVLEGKVQKKSTGFINMWQNKYFKVIAAGAYLAYYDKKQDPYEKPDIPNGVFCIRLLRETENADGTKTKNIFFNEKKPKEFSFNYGDRLFECRVSSAMECQLWFLSLQFLSIHAGDIVEFDDQKPLKYFTNYKQVVKFRAKQDEKDEKENSNSDNEETKEQPIDEAITDSIAKATAKVLNSVDTATQLAKVSQNRDEKKREETRAEMHKFQNIDMASFSALVNDCPQMGLIYDEESIKLSRQALINKRIWYYLKSMPEEKMMSRVIFGFLRKRSSGRVQVFVNRWWFLISSRPLSINQYIRDDAVLTENELPPLLEFDTLYYYYMDSETDISQCQGSIRTTDISNILRKDMSDSKEDGHAFILDVGGRRYHLNSLYYFECERWIQALYISMQTARESKSTINQQCKNISMVIINHDTDREKLKQQELKYLVQQEEKLEQDDGDEDDIDVETLLQVCSEIRDKLIMTIDACLAQPTPREDIVEFYMNILHMHILQILEQYWEQNAIALNAYQALQLVDWNYQYHESLKQFGCHDYALYNGFLTLCNTYALKIHCTLISITINILKQEIRPKIERKLDINGKWYHSAVELEEDRNNQLYTSAPRDLIKIYDEAFQVVRVKKIKELMLKMLKTYETITFQFQAGLQKFYDAARPTSELLPIDFLIAQCNNFFLFWQIFQDLINPMINSGIATEDDIQDHFNERHIIQSFNKMQDQILSHLTDRIFLPIIIDKPKQKAVDKKQSKAEQIKQQQFRELETQPQEPPYLGQYFQQPFMKLSMQTILTILLDHFEELTDQMEEKTRRTAWSKFLDRTVLLYIQSLLTSSAKIKQDYATQVIDKIKADQEHIKDRFNPMMSQRACNIGTEVLDDLTSFFECSAEFISVPCEKLRRTQGESFNSKAIQWLMALRTDMDRTERKNAIAICQDILLNFRDEGQVKKGGKKNEGLFSVVELLDEQNPQTKPQKQDAAKQAAQDQFKLTDSDEMSDDEPINMSDFMRDGGLDAANEEEKQKQKAEQDAAQKEKDGRQEADQDGNKEGDQNIDGGTEEKKEKDDLGTDTEPCDRMEGYMMIKKTKLDKKSTTQQLRSMGAISIIGQRKQYFCIQNGVLYQYDRKTARLKSDHFKLKQVGAIDFRKEDNNVNQIRMIYKKFYVIFTIESIGLAQKWLNSLQYVKDNVDKYLFSREKNLSRYQKLKVFERITGKSVYLAYDILLQRYEQTEMQKIWCQGHIYSLVQSNTSVGNFDDSLNEEIQSNNLSQNQEKLTYRQMIKKSLAEDQANSKENNSGGKRFELARIDDRLIEKFKVMVNESSYLFSKDNYQSPPTLIDTKTSKQSKQNSQPAASFKPKKGFQIDRKESQVEIAKRYKIMEKIPPICDLVFKINPGEIDLYSVATGSVSLEGELVIIIDTKVKNILMNRKNMGQEPFEVSQSFKNMGKHRSLGKSEYITTNKKNDQIAEADSVEESDNTSSIDESELTDMITQ